MSLAPINTKEIITPFLPSTTGAVGGAPAQPVHNWRGAPGRERPPLCPSRPFRVSRQCSPVSDRNTLPKVSPIHPDDSVQVVVFLFAWADPEENPEDPAQLRRRWFFGDNATTNAMNWFKAMRGYLAWWERQQTAVSLECLPEAINGVIRLTEEV
jgi:hypothetical protein